MRAREYYRAIGRNTDDFSSPSCITHGVLCPTFAWVWFPIEVWNYGQALEVFGEVVKLYPETSYGKQAWLWQGECLRRQGKYKTAEDFYEADRQYSLEPAFGEHTTYRHAWVLLCPP